VTPAWLRHALEGPAPSGGVDEGNGAKTLPQLQSEHLIAPRGRRDAPASEETEQSALRNYVRDLILGLNDGIVSVYALVAGLVGAASTSHLVGVAGVIAAAGGALSMGLGEYLSTKSQAQYYASEARREREHIRKYPDLERQELLEMLEEQGYPAELRGKLLDHFAGSEDRFVDFMMREEFGVGKESDRSPLLASLLIMAAFLVGAAPAVLPFFFVHGATVGLWVASALCIAGLFVAGFAKGRLSGINAWRSGGEMMLLGIVAGAVTFAVGFLIPGARAA